MRRKNYKGRGKVLYKIVKTHRNLKMKGNILKRKQRPRLKPDWLNVINKKPIRRDIEQLSEQEKALLDDFYWTEKKRLTDISAKKTCDTTRKDFPECLEKAAKDGFRKLKYAVEVEVLRKLILLICKRNVTVKFRKPKRKKKRKKAKIKPRGRLVEPLEIVFWVVGSFILGGVALFVFIMVFFSHK